MNKDQKNIDNQILTGKTLLLRVDLNVPVIDGKVQDDTRIKSVIPSIKHIINKGGNVVLCSHFGRPKGEMDTKYSLKPMSEILSKAFLTKIVLATSPKVPICGSPEGPYPVSNKAYPFFGI